MGVVLSEQRRCEMTTTTITIPLDAETAKIYTEAPAEIRRKLQLLLGLWVREFTVSPCSLQSIMNEISRKAQKRGLTPEILESRLNVE